ncbi:putative RNA-directed DNA polymerase from mobile element jockey-like 55, partial [Homarus americanus]
MILVRATIPSLEVEPVHCGDGVEAQTVRIYLANDSLVVYNIYKPPPKRLEAGELLTQATQELVLIAGDFNAHHPTINPTTSMNQDGHHLVELLTDVPEITLINTGEPTHILGGTLDLTFISTELVPEVDDELTSDHFAKTTTLRMELLPPPPRPPPRWNSKKANWKLYQDEFQKWYSNYEPAEDIDQLNQDLTDAIQHAAEEAIPKTNPTNRHHKDFWFYNDEINYLRDRMGKRVNMMRTMTGPKVGVGHVVLRTLYIHAIRSLTDYAKPALNTLSEWQWEKLEVAHNNAIRVIIKAPMWKKIENLHMETGLTSLQTRRERLTACFATKLITRARETDAVNRLELKDTTLSKGPDTMSPDYSTPAPWESPPAVFNIGQEWL